MNIAFMIIIIILLFYIIYDAKKDAETAEKPGIAYEKILPEYVEKTCEITVKEPLVSIDIMFSVKGVLLDVDEEWVMMEVDGKKGKVLKMFRIDNIKSIKELINAEKPPM